ncbi:MAG: hypothetical protein IJ404_01030 [Clostridia bacterium]|nr:hypothetical protein [Clostridia bacterium]
MKFFGKKDLAYLLVIAILILTTVFFAFKGMISEEKYEKYRGRILNRALESSIQLLGEYIGTEEPHLSAFLSSRLTELPLSGEEREAVILFCSDVARSKDDPDSKRRSLLYAEELMTALIDNRDEIKRGDTSSIPLYEGEVPTLSQAVDEPYYSEAKKILGVSDLYSYTRGSVIGYRTSCAYAEFEEGVFIRYLYRRDGKEKITHDEAQKDAEKFAKLYCNGEKPISESAEDGYFRFVFDGFYVDVSAFGGVMRYERTKI